VSPKSGVKKFENIDVNIYNIVHLTFKISPHYLVKHAYKI